MHLLFLGTAASEGYPNAFCHCENCNAARQEGGASLRKRSSVLIDGQLLIDYNGSSRSINPSMNRFPMRAIFLEEGALPLSMRLPAPSI